MTNSKNNEQQIANYEDSKNNNGACSTSRLNDALIPKIVHQSTKSKILINDETNLIKNTCNFDYFPLGKYILIYIISLNYILIYFIIDKINVNCTAINFNNFRVALRVYVFKIGE